MYTFVLHFEEVSISVRIKGNMLEGEVDEFNMIDIIYDALHKNKSILKRLADKCEELKIACFLKVYYNDTIVWSFIVSPPSNTKRTKDRKVANLFSMLGEIGLDF